MNTDVATYIRTVMSEPAVMHSIEEDVHQVLQTQDADNHLRTLECRHVFLSRHLLFFNLLLLPYYPKSYDATYPL